MPQSQPFPTHTLDGLGNEALFVNDVLLDGLFSGGDGAVNLSALLIQVVRDAALLGKGGQRDPCI